MSQVNQDSCVHGLFPTPIGIYNIGRSFSSKEVEFINGLEKTKNIANSISLKTHILNEPELFDIRKECSINLNRYFNEVFDPFIGLDLSITQSWVNYSQIGERHHLHGHPNSYISAVLFIQGSDTSNSITFVNSPCGLRSCFQIMSANNNIWNSSSWNVPLSPGDIIFFPSDLQHEVPPIEDDCTRITISFNSFISGQIGDEGLSNELTIKTDGYIYKEKV